MDEEYGIGSIVRVRLRNFLTYADSTFYPGPSMNMVIGPNGTGKSSVVCAIALGVGGKPDVLGRAKELQDFIKHGEPRGRIELELRNTPSNIVIQRTFKKGERSSQWKIDDQIVTEAEVKKCVAQFNIQVDNLCQFLPQDKVAEFARMDPSKLLRETERAAGSTLISQHDQLVEKQREYKGFDDKILEHQSSLKILTDKNEFMQGDVVKLQELENIEAELRRCDIKIKIALYNRDIEYYTTARAEVDDCKQIMDNLNQKFEPVQVELQSAKSIVSTTSASDQIIKAKVAEIHSTLQATSTKLEDFEKLHADLRNEIMNRQKQEKSRLNNVIVKEAELEKLVRDVDSKRRNLITKEIILPDGSYQPSIPKVERIIEEINQLQESNSILTEKRDRIEFQRQGLAQEVVQKEHQKRTKLVELQNLDNIRTQRLHIMKNNDRSLYDAIVWLRDNQDKFQGRVFEPVLLEISVKNKLFAKYVEASIPYRSLTSFLCEKAEDYFTFKKLVIQERKLRVNVSTVVGSIQAFKSQMNREAVRYINKLKNTGFEHFILEAIEGPDPILTFLCNNSNIHRIPFATRELDARQQEEAERTFPRFSAGSDTFTVKRAYGSISTRGDRLPEARILTSSVDLDYKAQLESDVSALHRQISEAKENDQSLINEISGLRSEFDSRGEEIQRLDDERKMIAALLADYKKHDTAIDPKRAMLERERNRPSLKDEIRIIHERIFSNTRKRAECNIKLEKALYEEVGQFHERAVLLLEQTVAQANVAILEDKLRDARHGMSQSEADYNHAKNQSRILKIKAKESHEIYKRAKTEASEEDALLFVDNDEENIESLSVLESLLISLETRRETINELDPEILNQYNQRIKEISLLEKKLERQAVKATTIKEDLQLLHDAWKVEIDKMIVTISLKFGNSFASIGCAGEVKLRETEGDYSKWGIEIHVKFRDTEQLQQLTANRQSGGERSVSTMLYLISMQSLSKSPFRVVDEINQGMDPRNERLVHRLIVRAACEVQSSQYFLITPKLLPDLEYHVKMRVLIVYNGVWQPEKWDLNEYVEKAKARKAAAISS